MFENTINLNKINVKRSTYNNRGDRRIDRGALADLHLVHLLLEHRTPGIGPRDDVHLDNRLRVPAPVVRRLHGDAVLLACVELAHRLDQTAFGIDFELLQTVVRHVVNAVGDLGVRAFVVVRRFDLLRALRFFRVSICTL